MMAANPKISPMKMACGLFAMQGRHLCGCFALFGSVFFVLSLLVVACGTLGWLQTAEDAVRLSWMALLPLIFVNYYILIHKDLTRSDYFRALGYGALYRRIQALFLGLSLIPLYLFAGVLMLYMGCGIGMMLKQLALMLFFELSAVGSLYAVRRLIETYRLSTLLYMTIAGPWCLVTWVVAISGSRTLMEGGNIGLHLVVLAVAWLWWLICGIQKERR